MGINVPRVMFHFCFFHFFFLSEIIKQCRIFRWQGRNRNVRSRDLDKCLQVCYAWMSVTFWLCSRTKKVYINIKYICNFGIIHLIHIINRYREQWSLDRSILVNPLSSDLRNKNVFRRWIFRNVEIFRNFFP